MTSRRPHGRRLVASGIRAMLPLVALATIGCDTRAAAGRGSIASPLGQADGPLPPLELLIATDDSSFWIRTGPQAGPDGIEVLRAPLVLAMVDGRWQELYVAEQDFSFPDAVLTAQALWRRDLLSGDSTVVATDSVIPRLALEYARSHPDELPLQPDELEEEDPSTVAGTEVFLHGVHGPYASVELYADLHLPGGRDRHELRRMVVELASGEAVGLPALVDGGDATARELERRGRTELLAARDSSRRLALQVNTAAVLALDHVTMDPANFALAQVGGGPGVVFYAIGTGPDEETFALPTAPIAIGSTPWWGAARAALPDSDSAVMGDERERRWRHGALSVNALPDPPARADGEYTDDGWQPGTRIALADSAHGEWVITRLGSVPRRLYWLVGEDSLDAGERRALRRAFRDAALADGTIRATGHRGRGAGAGDARSRATTFTRTPSIHTYTR